MKNKKMRDPSGYGNNAINTVTGRPNEELNRDGGNSCSNPNWGTSKRGDANPDTQKESTAIQQYESLHNKRISKGHSSVNTNPLENPEFFTTRLFCNKCNIQFGMPLILHNELTCNCGFLNIEKRARIKLCPKCHEIYLKKQNKLKKEGLFTDIEAEKLANKRGKSPYGWQYKQGFIDGYIEMRDGEMNILKENK